MMKFKTGIDMFNSTWLHYMNFQRHIYFFLFLSAISLSSLGQKMVHAPDLSKNENFQVVGRDLNVSAREGKIVVHLSARPNNGVVWIKGSNFTYGTISFDVKGKNVPQQSFVGVAFHKVNDSTYDAVYLRPFNFQSTDPVRKVHCVQYISLPQHEWFVLRDKFPGQYENGLQGNVDPESWVHVRITVEAGSIQVFINQDEKPSLVVQPLSIVGAGAIGFWVGNGSDGDFSNLSYQNH